jgi:hypothetical protein
MASAADKVQIACEYCRHRRIRCDGNMPCSSCIQRNKTCSFPAEPPKKRGPKPKREREALAAQTGDSAWDAAPKRARTGAAPRREEVSPASNGKGTRAEPGRGRAGEANGARGGPSVAAPSVRPSVQYGSGGYHGGMVAYYTPRASEEEESYGGGFDEEEGQGWDEEGGGERGGMGSLQAFKGAPTQAPSRAPFPAPFNGSPGPVSASSGGPAGTLGGRTKATRSASDGGAPYRASAVQHTAPHSSPTRERSVAYPLPSDRDWRAVRIFFDHIPPTAIVGVCTAREIEAMLGYWSAGRSAASQAQANPMPNVWWTAHAPVGVGAADELDGLTTPAVQGAGKWAGGAGGKGPAARIAGALAHDAYDEGGPHRHGAAYGRREDASLLAPILAATFGAETAEYGQLPPVERAQLAQYFAVLAVGYRIHGAKDEFSIADAHFERSRALALSAVDEPTRPLVSALVLLAYYSMGMQRGVAATIQASLAWRLARACGLTSDDGGLGGAVRMIRQVACLDLEPLALAASLILGRPGGSAYGNGIERSLLPTVSSNATLSFSVDPAALAGRAPAPIPPGVLPVSEGGAGAALVPTWSSSEGPPTSADLAGPAAEGPRVRPPPGPPPPPRSAPLSAHYLDTRASELTGYITSRLMAVFYGIVKGASAYSLKREVRRLQEELLTIVEELAPAAGLVLHANRLASIYGLQSILCWQAHKLDAAERWAARAIRLWAAVDEGHVSHSFLMLFIAHFVALISLNAELRAAAHTLLAARARASGGDAGLGGLPGAQPVSDSSSRSVNSFADYSDIEGGAATPNALPPAPPAWDGVEGSGLPPLESFPGFLVAATNLTRVGRHWPLAALINDTCMSEAQAMYSAVGVAVEGFAPSAPAGPLAGGEAGDWAGAGRGWVGEGDAADAAVYVEDMHEARMGVAAVLRGDEGEEGEGAGDSPLPQVPASAIPAGGVPLNPPSSTTSSSAGRASASTSSVRGGVPLEALNLLLVALEGMCATCSRQHVGEHDAQPYEEGSSSNTYTCSSAPSGASTWDQKDIRVIKASLADADAEARTVGTHGHGSHGSSRGGAPAGGSHGSSTAAARGSGRVQLEYHLTELHSGGRAQEGALMVEVGGGRSGPPGPGSHPATLTRGGRPVLSVNTHAPAPPRVQAGAAAPRSPLPFGTVSAGGQLPLAGEGGPSLGVSSTLSRRTSRGCTPSMAGMQGPVAGTPFLYGGKGLLSLGGPLPGLGGWAGGVFTSAAGFSRAGSVSSGSNPGSVGPYPLAGPPADGPPALFLGPS